MIQLKEKGVTLIETLIFISVVGVALVLLLKSMDQTTVNITKPTKYMGALEMAEMELAKLMSYTTIEHLNANQSIERGSYSINIEVKSISDLLDSNRKISAPPSYGLSRTDPLIPSATAQGHSVNRITVEVKSKGGDSVTVSGFKVGQIP